MNSNDYRHIESFEDLEAILKGKQSRKVGNNTYLYREDADTIRLRLHATDILTFCPDRVMYNTGGWRTATTKARMNAWGPLSIFQQDHAWYFIYPVDSGDIDYFDWLTVHYDGSPLQSWEQAA